MKALGIIGFVIALLMFLAAMYLQFMLAPEVNSMEIATDVTGTDDFAWAIRDAAQAGVMNMAYLVLFGGGLSLILSVIPFIKTKNKLALIGAILSLAAVVIGLIHGTHMFS